MLKIFLSGSIMSFERQGPPITNTNDVEQLLPFAVLFVAAIWLGVYLHKKRGNKFKTLENYLKGKASSNFLGLFKFNGEYRNKKVFISYTQGGRHSPAIMEISLSAMYDFSFQVSQESSLHKLTSSLGLTKDIEIGSPQFDSDFKIASADKEKVKNFLAIPQKQNAITNIFKMEFDIFKLIKRGKTIPGKIKIISKNPDLDHYLSRENMLMILETLYTLSED